MTGRKAKKVIDAVWRNDAAKRYIPRAYSGDGPGWGIWDQVKQCWIEGSDVLKIDPQSAKLLS